MIRKHSGMSLLQSDFSRHSLINLLGPAELRVFIKFHARIFHSHTKHRPMYSIVLKQSSGPTPSGSLEERIGKAKSSDVASSIPEYYSELFKLNLTHTKWKRIYKSNFTFEFTEI
jgi:hypothetical protein